MKAPLIIFCSCLLGVMLFGCSGEGKPVPLGTPQANQGEPLATPDPDNPVLFIDTNVVRDVNPDAYVSRYRFVKINTDALLDKSGEPLELAPGTEITVNLFPDVAYTGVIERSERSDIGYSWVGHLKEIEYSELTLVYTGGIFIGKFAHPGGVYEVSTLGEDLYWVIMIDQLQLPGGEG